MTKLPDWAVEAIVYRPLEQVAPGIEAALVGHRIPFRSIELDASLNLALPDHADVLMLGAVFEPFALELMAWARQRAIPVAAVEEVAQLGLNQADINNYDAPFDRLFLASHDEEERFVSLGYSPHILAVSGLPSYERIAAGGRADTAGILRLLGMGPDARPIVYTTSPLRSRLAIHNKDDSAFRVAILRQLAASSHGTGRRVIVKLHPNEDMSVARPAILSAIPNAIIIGREMSIDDILAVAGVLVNRGNSQTCLEAVLRGVPTVVAACGLRTLFHGAHGVQVIETPEQIPDAVRRAFDEAHPTASEFVARHLFLPESGVAGFLASELANLAGRHTVLDEPGWNWLVRSTLFVGGHARALRVLGALAPRSPWQSIVAAALAAHLAGDRQSASDCWRQCSAIDPGWFFPHYELAHLLLAEGRYEEAMSHAKQAIALHPPFHSLWHELPMRVIVMSAYRALGNHAAAAAEMEKLSRRGLVEIVPELLIERAAQFAATADGLEAAFSSLQRALEVIQSHPVGTEGDAVLRERASQQVGHVADTYERMRKPDTALRCLAWLAELQPNNSWVGFRHARVELMVGRLAGALHDLAALAGIPGAPQSVVERVLDHKSAAELLAFWPETPGGPLRQVILLGRCLAWAAGQLIAAPRDWPTTTSVALLTWLFVFRHWLRRLRSRPRPL